MNNFLKNLFFHMIIILSPFLFLIITYELQFEKIDVSDIYPKYFKLNKNNKINELDLLIAGDSRAERQIIPQELKSEKYKKIINIGISSGDIVRLKDFILYRKEAKLLYNNKTSLLVSISPWQINDNYQKWGYLSNSTFKYLGFFEKLKLLKNKKEYFKYVLATHKKKLKDNLNINGYKSDIDSLGYLKVEGDVNLIEENKLSKMIFELKNEFSDYKNDGYRWREFKKSVEYLSSEFDKLILIINPVTEKWRSSIKNTHVEIYNIEFIKKLKQLKKDSILKNIIIWDFYNEEIFEISDENYYDTHHLNKLGAKKFSSLLKEKLSNL